MRVGSCLACPKCPGISSSRVCGRTQRRDSCSLRIPNHRNLVAVQAVARAEELVVVLVEAVAEPVAPEAGQAAELAALVGLEVRAEAKVARAAVRALAEPEDEAEQARQAEPE